MYALNYHVLTSRTLSTHGAYAVRLAVTTYWELLGWVGSTTELVYGGHALPEIVKEQMPCLHQTNFRPETTRCIRDILNTCVPTWLSRLRTLLQLPIRDTCYVHVQIVRWEIYNSKNTETDLWN